MASPHRIFIVLTAYFAQYIVFLSAANDSRNSQPHDRTLYIGSMAPMTGKRAWWGAGIPLAIEMAFEDINARSDVLHGYRVKLIRRDTQVSHLIKNQ